MQHDSLLKVASRATAAPGSSFYVPGLAIAFCAIGQPIQTIAVGVDGYGQPVSADSLFPVASNTKIATALAVLRLYEAGQLGLDDQLSRYLPEAAAATPDVTIRRLLSHTSGLPFDLAPDAVNYAIGLTWAQVGEGALRTPLATAPGLKVQYSNVAYALLGLIIKQLTGTDFERALDTLVIRPLGIEGYLGTPRPRTPMYIADVGGPHAKTPLEHHNSDFWYGLSLPWVGLTTTAEGMLRLALAYIDEAAGGPGLLRPETLAEATRNQTGTLAGGFSTKDPFLGLLPSNPIDWSPCPWGLGVELLGEKTPHWAPRQASPTSFGHLGSTGTVVWADPVNQAAWAILGTRTTDNGWMLRYGPVIGATVLSMVAAHLKQA